MDELCCACLCSGRNLYFILETGYYDLYSQIINEIQVTDAMRMRLCWECRALLRRFGRFAARARDAYQLLLQHKGTSAIISQPSRLSINHISSTSHPQIQVKVEIDYSSDHLDHIKTEADEHCEPETFVNGLELKIEENDDSNQTPKKKTKKKLKGNKKKKKVKSLEDPVLSDGFSDREVTYEENKHEIVENTLLEEKVEKEENSYICAKCGLPFSDKVLFDAHVQMVHIKLEPPKPRRPRCKEPLAEKPQCVECGKTFSSRKTYRYHLNVLHKGQNRYPCPRCGKVYQWKSNLGRHLRTHKARDDGELYCALCDKRFASVATYRQHLRVSRRHVSESEFSFVCNECGKKFVNKTRLRDHVDWEHLQKIKFRCQLCNKPFKCHTSLYVHMQNVHRNKEKKDNLCHVCGKSYQNAAKLKYHIVAMHTSETPYQCGQCAAAFGWYSSLYRHTREVHYKLKVQPKKSKKSKKLTSPLPTGLVPPAP